MDSKSTMTASSCQTWACYPRCENCTDKEILAAIREGYQPKNGSAPKSIGQSNSINQVECICPKCDKKHIMNFHWIGRGTPRKYCQNCRDNM